MILLSAGCALAGSLPTISIDAGKFPPWSLESGAVIVPCDHFPPWKFADEIGPISGIDIRLINELLSRLDLEPDYKARPWKRCLAMMKDGTADLMNGLLKRPEREEYMLFIEPPYKTETAKAFYVRTGSGTRIDRYEDLEGLAIGVTLGAKYFPRFDNDSSLDKQEVDQDLQNLKMLSAGRLDAIIGTEITIDYLIVSHGLAEEVEKASFRHSDPTAVYFAVSKSSPLAKRSEELSAAVREMVRTGLVQEIIQNYLEDF